VVELRAVTVSVIDVLASPEACDALAAAALDGTSLGRAAPDELLVIGGTSVTADHIASAIDDPDALVLDVTDAWSSWTLEGSGAPDVFARLSELRLPGRGFAQGAVGNMAAKIVVDGDRITVMVPSMLAGAFHERVLRDGRLAGVREAT